MRDAQRIEMQERALAVLAKRISSNPRMQERLIQVAKVDALEAMDILPPVVYPGDVQKVDL